MLARPVTSVVGCLGLLAGLLALSVGYRVYRGKPVLNRGIPDATFHESWRAGGTSRVALPRLGRDRSILWVAVTLQDLWVGPHLPFNLLFIPEALHLDFRIPGRTILDVRETPRGSGRCLVEIRFRHATGEEDRVRFIVQDIDRFRDAVARIRDPR